MAAGFAQGDPSYVADAEGRVRRRSIVILQGTAGTGGKPPTCDPMPKYNTCAPDQIAEFDYANTVKYASANAYTYKALVAVYKSGAGYLLRRVLPLQPRRRRPRWVVPGHQHRALDRHADVGPLLLRRLWRQQPHAVLFDRTVPSLLVARDRRCCFRAGPTGVDPYLHV